MGGNAIVDEQGQRRKARFVLADRKSTVTRDFSLSVEASQNAEYIRTWDACATTAKKSTSGTTAWMSMYTGVPNKMISECRTKHNINYDFM